MGGKKQGKEIEDDEKVSLEKRTQKIQSLSLAKFTLTQIMICFPPKYSFINCLVFYKCESQLKKYETKNCLLFLPKEWH